MDNKRRKSNTPNWILIMLLTGIVLFVVIIVMIVAINASKKTLPHISPSAEPENTSTTPAVSTPPTDEYTDETQGGGLIYTDDRVPYYRVSNPTLETIQFDWTRQDNRGTMSIEVSIDKEMYNHYRDLGRYYRIDDYHYYIKDSNNKAIIAEIVEVIRDMANNNSYSDAAVVRELAKFVQDVIEYQYSRL